MNSAQQIALASLLKSGELILWKSSEGLLNSLHEISGKPPNMIAKLMDHSTLFLNCCKPEDFFLLQKVFK